MTGKYWEKMKSGSPMSMGDMSVLFSGAARAEEFVRSSSHEMTIITAPRYENENLGFDPSGAATAQELRTWALLWDKIIFCNSSIAALEYGELPADFRFLIDSGVLLSAAAPVHPAETFAEERIYDVEAAYFPALAMQRYLRENKLGTLAVARNEKDYAPDHPIRDKEALYIKINNAIPVPDACVPLDDLLHFKAKRSDELGNLRQEINKIYQRILSAPDRPMSELTEIKSFYLAIQDQLKASSESHISFRLVDVSAAFNVPAMIGAFLATLPLGIYQASLSAAGAGFGLEIGKSMSKGSTPSDNSPFAYITSYHNEIFSGKK